MQEPHEGTPGPRPSIFDNPPIDQWAMESIVDKEGTVLEEFRVPFTQTELDAIIIARNAANQKDWLRAVGSGGPAREIDSFILIPRGHWT